MFYDSRHGNYLFIYSYDIQAGNVKYTFGIILLTQSNYFHNYDLESIIQISVPSDNHSGLKRILFSLCSYGENIHTYISVFDLFHLVSSPPVLLILIHEIRFQTLWINDYVLYKLHISLFIHLIIDTLVNFVSCFLCTVLL